VRITSVQCTDLSAQRLLQSLASVSPYGQVKCAERSLVKHAPLSCCILGSNFRFLGGNFSAAVPWIYKASRCETTLWKYQQDNAH